MPCVTPGKNEDKRFGWCLILTLQLCSEFSKKLLFNQTPRPLIQATFSWENRFHEATKWHCCPVRVDLREGQGIVPVELQARLLLVLLEKSNQTKHIQLPRIWITWPLQCQILLHWWAHLLSPYSFFCSFCLIFKGGSWIASILTLLMRTEELWGFYYLWDEDWSQCQNFLAL